MRDTLTVWAMCVLCISGVARKFLWVWGAVKGSSGSRLTGVPGRGSGGEAHGRWRIFEKINENSKENFKKLSHKIRKFLNFP